MTAAGRCIVVDAGPEASDALTGLPGPEFVSSATVDHVITGDTAPVDLVVIASPAPSAVPLAQRVHRLVPQASIAILTDDVPALRRQLSFAPGVPLDVLVVAVDGVLVEQLVQLRQISIERRRHAAILRAVAHHAAASTSPVSARHAAVGGLLEHAPIAVLVARPTGELLGWNRRAEQLLHLAPAILGHPVGAAVPGAGALLHGAVPGIPPPGGAGAVHRPLTVRIADRIDIEVSAVATQTEEGQSVVLFLAADVTAYPEAERERDRLAGHVELLGRISEVLMESLDRSRSLTRLAAALVPTVADWVSIQLRDEHDQLYDVVTHHHDDALEDVTRRAALLAVQRGCLTAASRRASLSRREVLLPIIDPDALVEQVPDAELRSLIGRLGMGTALAVPIPGRTRNLGSLLLANAPGGRRFTETDLALAIEVGRRTGIALDNARLFASQRHLATELQQSLLTAPPTLPFADIAVRYVAAAQEAQVGGDWYDAFRQRSGELMVTIGDVIGHDTRAAAAMGQVRTLLRGIGFTAAETPAEVLTRVDEAIDGLELSTMATAVVAQLCPHGGGTPGDLALRWSNGGHPPPIVLDPQGHAHLLTRLGDKADLLLGVDATTARRTEQTTLSAGSTLFLYTDGLIERRGGTLDDGLARLLVTIEEHADAELDHMCEAIVRRMVPLAGEDDVAIVAVRPRSAGRLPA